MRRHGHPNATLETLFREKYDSNKTCISCGIKVEHSMGCDCCMEPERQPGHPCCAADLSEMLANELCIKMAFLDARLIDNEIAHRWVLPDRVMLINSYVTHVATGTWPPYGPRPEWHDCYIYAGARFKHNLLLIACYAPFWGLELFHVPVEDR